MEINDKTIEYILKRQDKILNLLTRIAKTLNIIPATEKEREDIQRTISKNIENAGKTYNRIEEAKTPSVEDLYKSYLDRDFSFDKNSLYSDVIGQDLLGGEK